MFIVLSPVICIGARSALPACGHGMKHMFCSYECYMYRCKVCIDNVCMSYFVRPCGQRMMCSFSTRRARFMNIYIYIYIHIHTCVLHIYIYTYIHTYISYIYIYIYIYEHTKQQRSNNNNIDNHHNHESNNRNENNDHSNHNSQHITNNDDNNAYNNDKNVPRFMSAPDPWAPKPSTLNHQPETLKP